MKSERGRGLRAEEDRRMKASPMNPPIGSTSSLMMVADFGRLDRPQGLGREAQQQAEQVEAQAPQHALAQGALGDVDPVLEGAVDQNEEQEQAPTGRTGA